ncbi:hypothetical protein PAXRUDRAFT_14369 [Paxillus rubicundulus Ve08.2h10]|uniref:Uncharacterized protein n=1 Tax=Paxillus rubicundulus Ve08.2h10 TaxID=930991 RepID=A0A0D0DH34_9AGAM|nr:hypothetical protein PAXRUDRAFT_14369 [Paxillus rubicundulus Ve08.2h10]
MLVQPEETENEHVDISDLSLGTLRGYREFAFPKEVSNISHDPHLSLDSADEWVTIGGIALYRQWEKTPRHTLDRLESISISSSSIGVLKAFRELILPASLLSHSYFGLDDAEHWITEAAFQAFILTRHRQTTQSHSTSVPRTPHRYYCSLPVTTLKAYEQSPCCSVSCSVTPAPPRSTAVLLQQAPGRPHKGLLPTEVIEVLDSDEETASLLTLPTTVKWALSPEPTLDLSVSKTKRSSKSRPSKRRKQSGAVKITTKLSVDEIEVMDGVLTTWTVPVLRLLIGLTSALCMYLKSEVERSICWTLLSSPSGINELPNTVPLDMIERLKGFPGLQTTKEIEEWHKFCQSVSDQSVRNWYQQKIVHPWFLPSVNGFLSLMEPDSWKLTPSHTNIAETAHAARNAETSISVALLTAVLQARERDVKIVEEIAMIEREGVMPRRWNGTAERDKHNAQRQARVMQKTTERDTQLGQYDELQAERAAGVAANKDSLARQKVIEAELAIARDSSHTMKTSALEERVASLRRERDCEKEMQRNWAPRQKEIDTKIQALKDSGLSGARLNGHRKVQRPLSSTASTSIPRDQNGDYGDDESADIHMGTELKHFSVPTQTNPGPSNCSSDPIASGPTPFDNLDMACGDGEVG